MSTPDQWRRCSSCGYDLPADSFRNAARDISRAAPRVALCIPCEQERRDLRKRADRWLYKARATIRAHAKKCGVPLEVMRAWYGWDEDRIARDLEHGYTHVCADCERPFGEMPNGLQDLTVDVADRAAPPMYGTNTRLVCQTCNRRKGTSTPGKWSAICLAYRIRREAETGMPRLFDLEPVAPVVRSRLPPERPVPPSPQTPPLFDASCEAGSRRRAARGRPAGA